MNKRYLALGVSLALHAAVIMLAGHYLASLTNLTSRPVQDESPKPISYLSVLPPPAAPSRQLQLAAQPPQATVPAAAARKSSAFQEAPPPPSAEEWAFAARYTLKNSKGYRYNWGQQVRSLMGTAYDDPDQGMVRLRVEIAPDGRLARLDTLWSTSAAVEQRARAAIQALPPLPPTPTGKPLIFEKTIVFTPYASAGPPSYQGDCLPDVPQFRNPFAWDGTSAPRRVEPEAVAPLDPQAYADCRKQLPSATIEGEAARDQRILDQWGSVKRGGE